MRTLEVVVIKIRNAIQKRNAVGGEDKKGLCKITICY
jgi:hypothetical protein